MREGRVRQKGGGGGESRKVHGEVNMHMIKVETL